MNTLGPVLLSSIAHATGFAVIAVLLYLVWRRYSPAAGALAAGASLVVMALVSLLVLAPWPCWWNPILGDVAKASPASIGSRQSVPPGSHPDSGRGSESVLAEPGTNYARTPLAPGDISSVADRIRVFAVELTRELGQPSTGAEAKRWRWVEWVAIVFFASLIVGVARMALGIWAVYRLRAASQTVNDCDLCDAVEVLRAELSCSKKIEVRETAELTSAATIGWRQPLILLPADWRDWTQTERRAVLAHEVAHVRRGDFLAGVLAHLSVALHFYHPVAHWLASRLRLEQELAADAWAAQLAGGSQAYLTTLAHLALRRDSHSITWPARAFLPSRGTFIRRIEMLRNTNSVRHASLSRVARTLTFGTLIATGLFVAGLRRPAATAGAAAAIQQTALAAGPTQNAGNEPFNCAFLPADTKMLIALRPSSLLERPQLRGLLDQLKPTLSPHFMEIIKLEEIDQILAFWEGNPQDSGAPGGFRMIPPPSGVVLRAAKPREWEQLLDQVLTPRREVVRHAGASYVTGTGPVRGWSAFVPDPQTLVFARDDLLRELIEDRNAPLSHHSWDEAWQKVVKGQVMVALDMRWARRVLSHGLRGDPGRPGQSLASDLKLDTISPVIDSTQSYALAVDTTDGIVVDLLGVASAENDAKPVSDTLTAVLTLAKNSVQSMRHDYAARSAAPGEANAWALQAADTLLAKTRIDTSGRFVHVQTKTSLDIGEAGKVLLPAISAAQAGARRAQSQNNLKQIALAILNYANDNGGHLPHPVFYGGLNNSIPYSWRVAILPYIDQNELYKQYNFNEAWDGPNNRNLIAKMPPIYRYLGVNGSGSGYSNACYFCLTGDTTALGVPTGFNKETGITFANIRDGASNTILIVEAKRDIPWTKPEDIPFDPNGPLPPLGGFSRDVFNVAFVDGSVRAISYKVDPGILKALITRASGEVIALDSVNPGSIPAPTASATAPPAPTATPKP